MTEAKARAIGVIPARWGSTRLPGKSLVPICGRPLIHWVLERVQQAESLSDVIVATDDERIVEAVAGCGGKAVMTRVDHPSGTDRVAEAIASADADVVVNIQGDEPLIEPALIDTLAERMLADPAWDMATASAPLTGKQDYRDPSVVKVVTGAYQQALYFSRYPIPFVRDGDAGMCEGSHWRHIGIYAYRRGFLTRLVATPPCRLEELEKLEQLRALFIGGRMLVIQTDDVGIGVDTPEDVTYVEALIREKNLL
jgi:3-deoxy-manno-octulosonate cytidylyltransferase (CMP-KDO synthetase)